MPKCGYRLFLFVHLRQSLHFGVSVFESIADISTCNGNTLTYRLVTKMTLDRKAEIFKAELILCLVQDAGFTFAAALRRCAEHKYAIQDLFRSGASPEEVSNSLLLGTDATEGRTRADSKLVDASGFTASRL